MYFQRDRAGTHGGFDVAIAIADHDAALRIDVHNAGRIENQLRLRLATVAAVLGSVRTNKETGERPEQLVDAAIDRVDLLERNVSAADSALIADDRQRQARRPQPVERRTHVRFGNNAIGIAVERNVDDQRFVAVEHDRGDVTKLGRKRPSRARRTRATFLPCRARANSRTSCVIFIEQKCGPHIEQKCATLAPGRRQRFVVKLARRLRIERQIELIFPAEFEARLG